MDDGYNRDGYVAAAPGRYDALAFKYRPALPDERWLFVRQQDNDGRAYAKRAAAMLDAHVLEWDAKDSKDQPVAKSAAAMLKLHPELFNAMVDQVMGYTAADVAADQKNS